MSTSLLSRSRTTAECTSRHELLRSTLSCRDLPLLWAPNASGVSQLLATPGPTRPSCDAARFHPLHRQAAGEGAGEVQTGLRQRRSLGT